MATVIRYLTAYSLIGILAACFLVSGASYVSAQTQDASLESTIRAAILSDPRSAGMAPADIEAMVAALTREARSAGITSEDIVWRPAGDSAAQSAPACETFLCDLNSAFGFDGSDYTIPIWLAASALMLIFLIATLLEYRHFRHLHPAPKTPDNPAAAL